MLIGLVGRPNVGKSTFFKAATLADVLIANYPFATIKPNTGMAYVKIKDLAPEFDKVAEPREGFVKDGGGVKGKWRFVPFELMDVAGLVEGASEGKGLGNEFLNNLAGADAFIHIVDMSGETDAEGKACEDFYPGEGLEVIDKELDKWYYGILMKVWKSFARTVEMQKQKLAEAVARQFSGLKVNEDDVKDVVRKGNFNSEKPSSWKNDEVFRFARELRRFTKPMIIAANKMDRPKSKENFEKMKGEFDYPMIACSAEYELLLKQADKNKLINYVSGEGSFEVLEKCNKKQEEVLNDVGEFMEVYGGTGVQEILNKVVFEMMEMVAVFPAGDKLVDSNGHVLPDCYLMKKGSTALDFAFRLHSDIGNGFVKAIHIKTKRAVGKDYEIKHRDGLEIMTK
ncbi:MAG: redox-regulated ATPase YchF [archaeon]